MALKITKANEVIEVKNLSYLIYGQPAMGKSTLANSANKVLTLDFDNGIYRAANRQDCISIETWADIASMTAEDIADYETIVIDTVGACMGHMRDDIIKRNPKMANGAGNLSLQGHGQLKGMMVELLAKLKRFKKDIILIAHEKEKEVNEEKNYRPDISGGSYNEIMKAVDFVGHLSLETVGRSSKRVLNFTPSENRVGKNCANLDTLTVPSIQEAPHFFAALIQQCKTHLNQLTAVQKEALELIEYWRNEIDGCESAGQLTQCLNELNEASIEKHLLSQIKIIMNQKAKAEHWIYDASSKKFTILQEKDKKEGSQSAFLFREKPQRDEEEALQRSDTGVSPASKTSLTSKVSEAQQDNSPSSEKENEKEGDAV